MIVMSLSKSGQPCDAPFLTTSLPSTPACFSLSRISSACWIGTRTSARVPHAVQPRLLVPEHVGADSSGQRADEHAVHALRVHLHDLEPKTEQVEGLGDPGYVTKLGDDQAG